MIDLGNSDNAPGELDSASVHAILVDASTFNFTDTQGVSYMNLVDDLSSLRVLVAQLVRAPDLYVRVMGSHPVGDSEFFFVPHLCYTL